MKAAPEEDNSTIITKMMIGNRVPPDFFSGVDIMR
jgi:hypothetical protein